MTAPPNPSTAWMPTAGGVLSIVSGSLAIIGAVVLAILTLIGLIAARGFFAGADAPPFIILFFISIYLLAVGILAIIGGISAVRRRNFSLALAGAIASLFTGGTIIGVVAIVFVALSRKEFAS